MKKIVMIVFTINGCIPAIDYPQAPQAQRQETIYSARQQCHDDERVAFAYAIIQTQLMEAALTCGQDEAYNRFVSNHQPALLDANQKLAGYFARRDYYSDGQSERDSYITELANAQSQGRGPEFCQSIALVVDQASNLTATDVMQFVINHHLINPDTSCPLQIEHVANEGPTILHGPIDHSIIGGYR
jgi:hypothetical protein